ncbi:MAG: hypothetical protein ABIZ57_01050, partial [Candidatus Limnocylindria bacterium]
MGAVATIAAYSSIGFSVGPTVELVSTARGNDASPSATAPAPLLDPSTRDASQEERSTLSGRS